MKLLVAALLWVLLGCAGEEGFTVTSEDGPTAEELAAERATDTGRLSVALAGVPCPASQEAVPVRIDVRPEGGKSVRFVPCAKALVTLDDLPIGATRDLYFEAFGSDGRTYRGAFRHVQSGATLHAELELR